MMKMHLLQSLFVAGLTATLVQRAAADPILPYQLPIAQQLTNDINSGTGNQAAFSRANREYHATSRTLSGDISILRNLDQILEAEPGYAALLKTAADGYLADFTARSAALAEQLRPAPRSSTKTSAQSTLNRINSSLSNAAVATTIASEISHLASAASRIPTASNTVQSALRQPISLSSMSARVGVLGFKSSRGFILGGTNFTSTAGTGNGLLNLDTGTFDVTAVANGTIVRAINLHVEGITTNTPTTYPLGVGQNTAYYRATDLTARREYHFDARQELTNSLVTNAWVTIDYIGSNYVLARFSFVGTNSRPVSVSDTNTLVTISQGDVQLNFSH